MSFLTDYMDYEELLALAFFFFCWIGYAVFAGYKTRHKRPSLLAVTNEYRTQWMHEMLKRDNRSVDAIMIGNLQRSITFFANTTIFLLLGLMTMLGYHDRASVILANIPFAKPNTAFMWEMKTLLLMVIFIYAFFKYTWSLRQYNYASIFVAAAPDHKDRIGEHNSIAIKGGYLIGNAARHFNNGLRAYYFGLAELAWFIHPVLFMIATAWVVFVTHRREYHSGTLKNLTQ